MPKLGKNKQFTQYANAKIKATDLSHVFFFSFLVFWCTEYAIVLIMTSSYVTELRNTEWELFLLYSEGLQHPSREAKLWSEVDRLEALIELES